MEKGEVKYESKSIMVTGGAGFIASWLVEALLKKYEEWSSSRRKVRIPIVVVDRLDSCSYPYNWGARPENWPCDSQILESAPDAGGRVTVFESLQSSIETQGFFFYRVDIKDESQVLNILRKHEIDTVLHLAAQTHVDDSFDSGHLYIEDNIMGTHNLLRAVKVYGKLRRFVHVSTDEVQSGIQEIPGSDDQFTVTNVYAATKAGAELICRAFISSHNIPILITRCNNVYGPGHGSHPIKVIPKFITALLNGNKLTVHGTGEAKRNYIHVQDVVSAFLHILERGSVGKVYGIGSETEISVLELVQHLASLIHPETEESKKEDEESAGKKEEFIDDEKWRKHVVFIPDRPFQDPRYHVDVTLLKSLGWKEEISFFVGLKEVVQWYRERHSA